MAFLSRVGIIFHQTANYHRTDVFKVRLNFLSGFREEDLSLSLCVIQSISPSSCSPCLYFRSKRHPYLSSSLDSVTGGAVLTAEVLLQGDIHSLYCDWLAGLVMCFICLHMIESGYFSLGPPHTFFLFCSASSFDQTQHVHAHSHI